MYPIIPYVLCIYCAHIQKAVGSTCSNIFHCFFNPFFLSCASPNSPSVGSVDEHKKLHYPVDHEPRAFSKYKEMVEIASLCQSFLLEHCALPESTVSACGHKRAKQLEAHSRELSGVPSGHPPNLNLKMNVRFSISRLLLMAWVGLPAFMAVGLS